MGHVTIVTPPDHTALVSSAAFESAFPDLSPGDAETLRQDASIRVAEMFSRPILRARYTETLRGSGGSQLRLTVRPIASIVSVSYLGVVQSLSEFEIGNANAGILYRNTGIFTDSGAPNAWSITTVAGWLVPDDDFTGSISVDATDDSYNGTGFPTHLVVGDTFRSTDFTNAANNGHRSVLTATTSKITVADALTTESAAVRKLALANLPHSIARAVLQIGNGIQSETSRESGVIEESIAGATTVRIGSSSTTSTSGRSSAELSASAMIAPYLDL